MQGARKHWLTNFGIFPTVDGTFPTGTAKYEKRSLATEIPIWDPSICIDCGKCAIVCPHATIRMKVFTDDGTGVFADVTRALVDRSGARARAGSAVREAGGLARRGARGAARGATTVAGSAARRLSRKGGGPRP